MSSVLLDNWTLHDLTFMLQFPYVDQSKWDDLENLLTAILLWDEIYYWDNGRTDLWKEEPQILNRLPPLTNVVLPPDLVYKVNNLGDMDVVASGAQQYLLIAQKTGLDYLPKRERYEYLTAGKYYHAGNRVWPKRYLEKVEKGLQKYYDDLAKTMGVVGLRFRFPLLVDYIRSQAGDGCDYITEAQHMRETGPLYEMRCIPT